LKLLRSEKSRATFVYKFQEMNSQKLCQLSAIQCGFINESFVINMVFTCL
jgi:hypothetical protein